MISKSIFCSLKIPDSNPSCKGIEKCSGTQASLIL